MLARQWQLGEFRGDDAGSAVSVTFAGAAHHPTWWRPEGGADPASWQQWTVNDTPLETVIEAEPETDTARFRLRIDGGARARRMLVAAGLNAMAAKLIALAPWPDDTPASSGAADALSVSAVADGEALAALAATWTSAAALPAELGGTAAQRTTFVDVMGSWLAWWQPRVAALGVDAAPPTADPPAWDRHRLEHRGTLAFAAAPTVRLHLDQYPGGGVDWHCADAVTGVPEDLPADAPPEPFAAPQPLQEISVPLPTSFAGMAAPGSGNSRTPPSTTARSTRRRRTWRGCCWCSSARCTATTGSLCRSGCRSARWSGWTPCASPTRSAVCTS